MPSQVLAGRTNVSVTIRIIDSTDGTPETSVEHNTSGIDLFYRRELAARVAITEAALAALTTAHTDGGIEHISDGYYRLDVPDAAFASGVDSVMIGGTVTGMIVIGTEVLITGWDPEDSVRAGLTALPNAAADAAGGLPISDAGGLDLDALNVNINDIETDTADMQPRVVAVETDTNELQVDWVNGGRLDLLLDLVVTTADLLDKLGAVDEAAAVGDPSATESVMQYVKQILNLIVGTTGVGTYPAEQAPADGINILEVLRAIHADTNVLTLAAINSEVVDVLKTDTITLPGQAAPPLTPTFEEALAWLYKTFRNRKTQTSTVWSLMADNESTVDAKATVSDDATTAIKQEVVSGP